jgi:metallophosphoesterase (TIGR00282 family)
MKLIFIADIMGKPGRKAVSQLLPVIRGRHDPAVIIANGENSAGGSGVTAKIGEQLFALGIDCLTGGNHSFDNREGIPYLSRNDRVLRPHNLPPGNPGSGRAVLPLPGGSELLVLNLQGRIFMPPIDCPFRCADAALEEWAERGPVFVDMHAEASSEKIALARYLDGRVTAMIGTHTHIQTADDQLLPGGTALLSDAGMTGPHGGIIGIKTELVLHRFLKQTPSRFELSKDDVRLQGAVVEFDAATRRAKAIERFDLALEE